MYSIGMGMDVCGICIAMCIDSTWDKPMFPARMTFFFWDIAKG